VEEALVRQAGVAEWPAVVVLRAVLVRVDAVEWLELGAEAEVVRAAARGTVVAPVLVELPARGAPLATAELRVLAAANPYLRIAVDGSSRSLVLTCALHKQAEAREAGTLTR
jgi:hypothetical protein